MEEIKVKNIKGNNAYRDIEGELCPMCNSKLMKLYCIGGGTTKICRNSGDRKGKGKCAGFISIKKIGKKWKTKEQLNNITIPE